MAHQRRLLLSCDCSRKNADVMLGCNLTPPNNNSYTGTIVVSSVFSRLQPASSLVLATKQQNEPQLRGQRHLTWMWCHRVESGIIWANLRCSRGRCFCNEMGSGRNICL